MNGTLIMPTITPRQGIVALGIALAAIGLLALVLPVSAEGADIWLGGYTSIDCGSAAYPAGPAGDAGCREALSDRRSWALPVGLLGLVAVIGGVMVRSEQQQSDTQPLEDEDSAS